MSDTPKKHLGIVVLSPELKIRPSDLRALREAGYVPLIGKSEQISVVTPFATEVNGNQIPAPPQETQMAEHRWDVCSMCGPMVRCGYCGNNCCNGVSSEGCPDNCASAYALQALGAPTTASPSPESGVEEPSNG